MVLKNLQQNKKRGKQAGTRRAHGCFLLSMNEFTSRMTHVIPTYIIPKDKALLTRGNKC